MKTLFILLFLSFQIVFALNVPQWFFNIKAKNNQLIGYGSSSNLEEAKKNAKNAVATSIHTKVDGFMKLETKANGDKISKKFEKSITVTTNIDLDNLRILKSQYYDNKWYIAATYDLSSFALQMKKKLAIYKLKNEHQNDYLSSTSIIKSLNDIIGKTLNYKIYIKDNIWWISYKDQALKIPEKRLSELFIFKDSNIIKIKTNKNVFKNNEELSFSIETKKKGFVSLFYVNEDGLIGKIFENKAIDHKLIYPTHSRIIVKNKSGKAKKFMLAVIFSKKNEKFGNIPKVRKMKLKNNNFPVLLELLDKYNYTTFISTVL